MNKTVAKKLSGFLFLTIFFCKIMISIAPVVAAHFDVKSVNAALAQLEMDDEPKPIDVKEMSVKEYLTVSEYHLFLADPIFHLDLITGNFNHAKHVTPFHPPVPTPPPNV